MKVEAIVEESLREGVVKLDRIASKNPGMIADANKIRAAIKSKFDSTDDEVSPDGPYFSVEIGDKEYTIVVLDNQSFGMAFG